MQFLKIYSIQIIPIILVKSMPAYRSVLREFTKNSSWQTVSQISSLSLLFWHLKQIICSYNCIHMYNIIIVNDTNS